MQEIRDALMPLHRRDLNTDTLLLAADKIAVPVRILLWDSGPLLRGTDLHPLRDANDLDGAVYENGHYGFRVAASDGSSSGGDWVTRVHPLHGLQYDGQDWHIEPMYDLQGSPMKLKRWMKQRLLRVNDKSYTMEEVLRFFVNSTSIHVDKNPTNRVDMELVNVQTLSYPAIVALQTAAFLTGGAFQATVPVDRSMDCAFWKEGWEWKATGITINAVAGAHPIITSPWDVGTLSIVRAA